MMTVGSDYDVRIPTVLVVDYDAALRRVLCRFLESEAFVTIVASNGAEALAYLRGGGEPDVILLDLRMPVMDGWTFRREQLRDKRLAKIPVVTLAGADTDRLQELDATASFQKPTPFAEVVRTLRCICDGALRQSREAP